MLVGLISPADENAIKRPFLLLNENGFHTLLNSIGEVLDLDALTAYHLTFIAVSHCERGYAHHYTTETRNQVFSVIIPLESVTDSPPELIITDSRDDSVERLKYENGVGTIL